MFGKLIRYQDEEFNVQIYVKRSSVQAATTRAVLQQQQIEAMVGRNIIRPGKTEGSFEVDGKTMAEYMVRTGTYPACIAATHTIKNLWTDEELRARASTDDVMEVVARPKLLYATISIDDFMDLPEALVDEWISAVYEVIPHWAPVSADQTPEEKEAGEEPAPNASETLTAESSSG